MDPTLRARALALGFLLLLPALATDVRAQAQASVSIFPVQGLRFGTLLPGVTTQVPVGDGQRRAELRLVGGGRVTIAFDLPPALLSPGGARLPLVFGPSDGLFTFERGNRQSTFDPRAPLQLTLPPGQGSGSLFLGGTAAPAAGQAPGTYTGTITVRVVAPGT